MSFFKDPFRNWFGYSRRERTASFILLCLIFAILVIRYSLTYNNDEIEAVYFESPITEKSNLSALSSFQEQKLFFFDPNTISYDSLVKLGINSRQAHTLINYRSSGGIFYKASDIRKIYGIEEELAAKLIPYVSIEKTSSSARAPNFQYQQLSPIEINTCDTTELKSLPGIGSVLSTRIIKYRNLLGGFARVDQLREVYGLPQETYEVIKDRIFADTTILSRININIAGFGELSRLPYLENYEITAILKYRELEGRIVNISDLVNERLLSVEKAKKIRSYLCYD